MTEFIRQCSAVLEKFKDKCAISYWDESMISKNLSYQEIWNITTVITEKLQELIVEDKRTCIALYMRKNHYIPSIILSLQHCNCAFIFLDPTSEQINQEITRKLNIKWIISYSKETRSTDFFLTQYSAIGNFENIIIWENNLITHKPLDHENILYVISTSGTTGHSKTVKVTENCIMSNINALRKNFSLTEDDVIYFGTPLTFDPVIVELFLALTTGCTLVIPPSQRNSPFLNVDLLFPKDCARKGVTVLQTVPSLFIKLNDADVRFILQKSSCRILAFGGEKFPELVLTLPRSENLKLFNLYGITEVSCWASICEVTDIAKITLGEPLPETEFEIRDANGVRISEGEGELYIGSDSRICYVNGETDCGLSKPVFRPTGDLVHIKDNKVIYLARTNHVVKRFGHKVNLLKIQQIVLEKTEIINACIWVESLEKLVLFAVIKEFDDVRKSKIIDKLRIKLLKSLPQEYNPDDIEIVPSLPITRHGKIDTRTLENIYYSSINCDQHHVVDVFQLLWCKYLGLSRDAAVAYLDCNFLDLGGNSIGVVQCLSEFKERVGSDFPNQLNAMLFEKTLRDCCESIKDIKIKISRKRKCDDFHSNQVQALDSIEMRIKWKYCLKACVDSSPVIVNYRLVAIGSFSHNFAILDCASGYIIAHIDLPDAIESACCASTCNKYVYTGCYDGNMYCIEVNTGNIIWKYSTSERIKCTPSIVAQHNSIIFGSYDKHLHCIDFNSGSVRWKTNVTGSVTSKPLIYKDVCYVATILGACFCISCSTGEKIWKYEVQFPIFGAACLISEYKYVMWIDVSGTLHTFSCDSGEKLWTFQAGGNIYSSIVNKNNFLIFGSSNGKLYRVEVQRNAGKLKYAVPLNSPISSTPTIFKHENKDFCLVGANKGIIYITDYDGGIVVGKLSLPGEVFSSPTVFSNYIYVGCRDNNVYCIEFESKEIKRLFF